MRLTLLLATVVGLLVSGCSTDESVLVGSPGDSEAPRVTTPGENPKPGVDGDDNAIPGTQPVDTAVSLRPEDALLRAEDVGGEWQEPSDGATDGYEVGANQTDCDSYWVVESLVAAPASSRRWFQPGANLNHEVFDTGRGTAAKVMAAAVGLPDACPSLTWLEGGNLAITTLQLDVADVAGLELISDVGEVWWAAHASRGNVVSRLQRVHFTPGEQPSGEAFREFELLVVAMVDRLADAPSVATTVDPPLDMPPITTMPPVSSSGLPPPPDVDPVAGHPLADALLSAADLPNGMSIDETSIPDPGDPDNQRLTGCEPSEALVTMDRWFELQRSFVGPDGVEGIHVVGRAPSVADAESAVEEFGRIGACDLTLDDEFEDARFAGGSLDGIVGAHATFLEIENGELFNVRFVAYQVGDVVGVLVLGSVDGTIPSLETHRLLTQAAVERVA